MHHALECVVYTSESADKQENKAQHETSSLEQLNVRKKVRLFANRSVCSQTGPSVRKQVRLFANRSVCSQTGPSVRKQVRLFANRSVCSQTGPSVRKQVRLSANRSICPQTGPSVRKQVRLFADKLFQEHTENTGIRIYDWKVFIVTRDSLNYTDMPGWHLSGRKRMGRRQLKLTSILSRNLVQLRQWNQICFMISDALCNRNEYIQRKRRWMRGRIMVVVVKV